LGRMCQASAVGASIGARVLAAVGGEDEPERHDPCSVRVRTVFRRPWPGPRREQGVIKRDTWPPLVYRCPWERDQRRPCRVHRRGGAGGCGRGLARCRRSRWRSWTRSLAVRSLCNMAGPSCSGARRAGASSQGAPQGRGAAGCPAL